MRWVEPSNGWGFSKPSTLLSPANRSVRQARQVGPRREAHCDYMRAYNAENRERLVKHKRDLRASASEREAQQTRLVSAIYHQLLQLAGLRVVVPRPVRAIYRQLMELAGFARPSRKRPGSIPFGAGAPPELATVLAGWHGVSGS